MSRLTETGRASEDGPTETAHRSASTPNMRFVYTDAAELLSVLADTVVDFELADRVDRVAIDRGVASGVTLVYRHARLRDSWDEGGGARSGSSRYCDGGLGRSSRTRGQGKDSKRGKISGHHEVQCER